MFGAKDVIFLAVALEAKHDLGRVFTPKEVGKHHIINAAFVVTNCIRYTVCNDDDNSIGRFGSHSLV